jgi:hypothetical protein
MDKPLRSLIVVFLVYKVESPGAGIVGLESSIWKAMQLTEYYSRENKDDAEHACTPGS